MVQAGKKGTEGTQAVLSCADDVLSVWEISGGLGKHFRSQSEFRRVTGHRINKQTPQGYFCLLTTCTRNPKFRTAPFTIPAKEETKKHITYYSYEAHTGLAKLQNQTGKTSVNR